MPSAKRAVTLVVGVAILAILAGVLLPVGINEVEGNKTTTLNLSSGETAHLAGEYNTTLDATTDADINITINHTAGGNSASATNLAEGTNTTLTVDGLDFTVNNTDSTASHAVVKFTYPTEAVMGNNAQALWGLVGFALVLAVFLAALRFGMREV